MKVYIDFDDVLCETAKYFTKIAKELFGIDVPYREVQFFNLKKTFDLSDEQYEEMMKATKSLLSREDLLIRMSHQENGLMNTILKEFHYTALINMVVKAVNRTMYII